jgi:hypothetical protein
MRSLFALIVFMYASGADAPGVTYRLVATEFEPHVICDEQARPRCWKSSEIVTKYEWRAN